MKTVKDNNTQIKLDYKQHIALDIDLSDAKKILFIGNLNGFFGSYYITSNPKMPVEFNFNTCIETAKYIPLIADYLDKNKNNVIVVIANKKTCEYFRNMFTYIKYNFCKFKNTQIKYKAINNDSEYIDFLNSLDNDMKFDYIIQNPPYSGSLHLDFLKKGYELLSDTGKMVIIEPATWLINVRKNGKAKLYDEIKSMLGKHVYKVVIENLNKQFDTALYVPFSVTYIDNNKEYSEIDFSCCGEHKVVNNLYDCNMIGDYEMIWSILNKIKVYGEKVGTMKDHLYKKGKTKTDENIWFCKYADIMPFIACQTAQSSRPRGGGYFFNSAYQYNENGDKLKFGEFFKSYYSAFWHYNNNLISKSPLHTYNAANKETDKIANNIYGTKDELENWKHFVFNNKIPLFTSIVLVIDQHNTCKDVLCWLTDKQYTDEEIYKLLNITKEEQEFIDRTIKKYERHSLWFKRYMCGPDSVSDEEVQKFIDSL
ncbi:hypothetical protein J6O48_11300 [bacterium]|nr:hypothetical protein [bacterium]